MIVAAALCERAAASHIGIIAPRAVQMAFIQPSYHSGAGILIRP
jgi:hypothetical protein